MRDLNVVAMDCMNKLDALHIRYGNIVRFEVNTRAKKRWGACKAVPGGYVISINSILLNEANDIEGLETTVLHELIHSCDGCMNHGALWKEYAERVNSAYGYHIKRCTNPEEKGLSEEYRKSVTTPRKANYIIKCNNCTMTTSRSRISDLVVNTGRYRCKLCGGSLSVIPQNALAASKLRSAK